MSKEREILKSGLWYTVGNILVKAIAFLSLPLFTNLMTTREYGIFGIYQAYETIFSVVVSLGVSGTVRAAYNEFKDNFNKYITSIITPIFIISGILIIFDGIYSFSFHNYTNGIYMLALILNCFGNALREIFSQHYVVQNKYKQNLFMSLAISVMNIGLSYFFCLSVFQSERHFARIWGTSLSAFIVASVLYIFQVKTDKTFIWVKAWKFSLGLGIPLIFHQLSLSILGQCDKIMIQNMVGYDVAGIYSSMTTLILVPQVIMHSFDNAWAGWFFNAINSKLTEAGRKEIQLLNRKMIITFMFVMMGFSLVSHEMVGFMVGEEFRRGVIVLYVLSVSVFSNFLYIFAVNIEYFYKKTTKIAIYTAISAIVNIVLNYFAILFMGYIGAAFATLCSRVLLLVLHTVQSRKLVRFDVVRNQDLFWPLLGVSVISLFSYLFDEQLVVRGITTVFVIGAAGRYVFYQFIKINER